MGKSRLLLLLALGICAVARAADPPAADPLDAALEQRIRGKAGLGDVEIAASWQRESVSTSVRVWGSGVGIWQDSTQFRLSRDEVVSLLKILSAAKVGTLLQPDSKAPAVRTPAVESPTSPLMLLGELTIVVGSERKSLQQLTKGEQSKPLREVVLAILSFCEKAAKTGVTASSMQDGLKKLAAGTLAPETFEAIVQRREDPKSASAGESWLLRINGLRITDRLLPKGQPPPPPRVLTLSREDFLRLARLLEENEPGALPKNLFAPAYTDVRIEVLGEDRMIPARAYMGVTPETHGAKQKAFDRLYDVFRALHERAQKDGTPVREGASGQVRNPATPASSPAAP
jgi:hypothetical protein